MNTTTFTNDRLELWKFEFLFINHNKNFFQLLNIYFSAHDIRYYANPPTFRSETNSATLRFTSDDETSEMGILMAYVLGKQLFEYFFSFVNDY